MRKKKEVAKLLKQCLVMVLCATMLLGQAGAFVPSEVFLAAEADENGFVIEDGVLTDYVGNATDVVIPDGVIEISSLAFYKNTTMVSVTIPEGVTEIENSTFNTCENLEMANLPESLEKIEANAFYGWSLKYIEIPENVSDISSYAFFPWDAGEYFTIIGTPGSYAETYAIEKEYLFNQFHIEFMSDYSVEYNSKEVDAFTAIGDMPEGNRDGFKIGGWYSKDGALFTEETIVDSNYYLYDKWVAKYPNIADAEVNLQKEAYDREQYVYTGAPITPNVWVKSDGVFLEQDVHYTVSYENNVEVGLASVIVQGIGDFSGTVVKNFYIVDKVRDMRNADLTFSKHCFRYDGTAKTPDITVTYEGVVLERDVDYTLEYSNNTEIGTAQVDITGIGKYTGTKDEIFWIYEVIEEPIVPDVPVDPEKKNLAGAVMGMYQYEYQYCDAPLIPIVMIKFDDEDAFLIENRDFTLTYYNNIEPGTATIVATGIGNYTGYITVTFEIVDGSEPDNDLKDARVILDSYDFMYDGTEKCPTPTVYFDTELLIYGVDYTVEYVGNVDAGTAYININGIGNYIGHFVEDFKIHAYELNANCVTLSQDNFIYDGTAKYPTVTVNALGRSLKEGRDYELTYSNNINAGVATVTINGTRNFCGTITMQYTIVEDDLLNGLVQGEDGNWYYYVDGRIATDYTGLVEYFGAWFYVENGVLNWGYTGLTLYYDTWYYVEGGVLNWEYTGLTNYYGTWYYIEGGILNWGYTGLTYYYGTWYYVSDGVLDWSYTGLCEYYGSWYYVSNGVLDWSYTGLCEYYGSWYYVSAGVLDWSYTGLCEYYGSWFYVEGGVLNWNYTSLVYHYGTWYYVANGVLDWNYTGYVLYYGTWYYVVNGVLVA